MLKTTSSTNPVVLAMIIFLGLMSGFVYYRQATAEVVYEIALPQAALDPEFLKFKDLRFDLSLFQNESFTQLKTFGEFPIQPGGTGKRDIFSP